MSLRVETSLRTPEISSTEGRFCVFAEVLEKMVDVDEEEFPVMLMPGADAYDLLANGAGIERITGGGIC